MPLGIGNCAASLNRFSTPAAFAPRRPSFIVSVSCSMVLGLWLGYGPTEQNHCHLLASNSGHSFLFLGHNCCSRRWMWHWEIQMLLPLSRTEFLYRAIDESEFQVLLPPMNVSMSTRLRSFLYRREPLGSVRSFRLSLFTIPSLILDFGWSLPPFPHPATHDSRTRHPRRVRES